MTQNEILEIAKEVYGDIGWTEASIARLVAFVNLVAQEVRDRIMFGSRDDWVLAEREACAKVCDSFQARDVGMQPAECAGAIRARGEQA